jgi:hypothetical protein
MQRSLLGYARLAAIAGLVLATSGCVNRLTASVTPGTDLASRRTFHVVKHAKDKYAVNEKVVARLVAMGRQATTGPEGAPAPADTEVVVAYVDKWAWDMTTYMLELTITFRDPKTDFPIASGNAFHTSLTRRSPEEMVDEVLKEIFKGGS